MKLFKLSTLAVLLFISAYSSAQQKYPSTLLWRITGNGLQKPSYLFGTFHLTDKRLFNFDDSVYNAIEKTDGYAMEVNPDELAAYYVNEMFDDIESGEKVKDVLNAEDYKKYSKRLQKKLNKPADKITTKDIVAEKNKWMTDYLKNGEMPTIIDAYLYNIARHQGKWVGGIEDLTDQTGIINKLFDETDIQGIVADEEDNNSDAKEVLEHMIRLYISQNLSGIDSMTNYGSGNERDILLTKRNIKMARRMDSLSALRSMFFAVGAAHLAGDSGVIELLKLNGFTLEPVLCSHKTEASKYTYTEKEVPWTDVSDSKYMYSLTMPGNPASVKVYGIVDMKFLYDVFNFCAYATMAVLNQNTADSENVYKSMAERMMKSTHITATKINVNGLSGREYSNTINDGFLRLRLFQKDNLMYVVMMFATKKDMINSADASKFFQSFTVNTSKPSTGEYVFTDSVMGISFNSTAQLELNEKITKTSTTEGWKVTAYSGLDIGNNAYVLLISKEVTPGNFIVNDSIILDDLHTRMKATYELNRTDTFMQGYKAIILSGANIENSNLYVQTFSVVRGNKNYSVMIVSDSAHLQNDSFSNISSRLTFMPYKTSEWQTFSGPVIPFSSWAPAKFRNIFIGDSADSRKQYVAFDTATSTSFVVIADTFSRYNWVNSDSSFWNDKTQTYNHNGDTVLSVTDISNSGLIGKEWFVKKAGSFTYKRIRALVDGKNYYSLYTSGDKAVIRNENADRFFSEFKIPAANDSFNIYTSKAALLLHDLESTDSLTLLQAVNAIDEAPFVKSDLPLLHEALFKQYKSPYTGEESIFINNKLGKEISKLNDSSAIQFIKENYSKLNGNKEELKTTALTILSAIKTDESYQTLASLAVQLPPVKGYLYYISSNLQDSFALTAKIFDSLLLLAKDTLFSPYIAYIGLDFSDSGIISFEKLKVYENDFINASASLVNSLKTSDDYEYRIKDLITLLGRFKTPQSSNAIKGYMDIQYSYLKEHAAITLIKNDEGVDKKVLENIAADMYTRISLYDELKALNKESLYPKKYNTQKDFAQALMYDVASNEDEEPAEVEFISIENRQYNGKPCRFYLFNVTYKYYDSTHRSYLGIAGAYDANSKKLFPAEDISGLYWDEEFDRAEIAEQLNKFLLDNQEDAEDEE